MKLIHLSDLHLGKRVNGFSMLEDQRYILQQILNIVGETLPQGIIIAGDIYDKTVPSEEAVRLFDWFLRHLSAMGQQVFVISGNHDSADRLAFGGSLLELGGIHISPVYCGKVEPIMLHDEHGAVAVWLLPFLKPSHVRKAFPDFDPKTVGEAVAHAIKSLDVDWSIRNILVAHQFVAGGMQCDSEELSVGGTDAVSADLFDGFDYVALGHLHGPQQIGKETVRYAGSPLKYSISEVHQKKSVSIVELGSKDRVTVELVDLKPLRDLATLRGRYDELTLRETYEQSGHRENYVHIILTDEDDIPNAAARLRVIYPYLMKLDYDNRRTNAANSIEIVDTMEDLSPMELFSIFFEAQNQIPINEEQRNYLQSTLEQIWGAET